MILLVDNYDSFTYNIAQMIGIHGHVCSVFRNDALSVEDVMEQKPDAVVLSPGPGKPQDAGICLPLIETLAKTSIPVLGVCLGHQAIGMVFGAHLVSAPSILHGKCTAITHDEKGIFANIPQNFEATRYHSFVLSPPMPAPLMVTATSDGMIMALKHQVLPMVGVQFHPESFACHHGDALWKNFTTLYNIPATRAS